MGTFCSTEKIFIIPNAPVSKILKILKFNSITVTFIQGDICEEISDAIINGSDVLKKNKTSVIAERAGPFNASIDNKDSQEISDSQPMPFGKAYLTKAGNLKANYLIHLCVPVWTGGDHEEIQLLKKCFLESYHIAMENNVGILSITDVSSGIFGIPVKIGRQTLIESLIKFITEQKEKEICIKEIKYVHYDYFTVKNTAEDFEKNCLEQHLNFEHQVENSISKLEK